MITLYRLFDLNGTLLYIGIADHWPSRMKQHSREKSWWEEVGRVEFVHLQCARSQAEIIERAVIRDERPRHNVIHNAEGRVELGVQARRAGPPSTDHFRVGDDVDHPTFGEGVVTEVRGVGERCELTIRFRDAGSKHLSAIWAPLSLVRSN